MTLAQTTSPQASSQTLSAFQKLLAAVRKQVMPLLQAENKDEAEKAIRSLLVDQAMRMHLQGDFGLISHSGTQHTGLGEEDSYSEYVHRSGMAIEAGVRHLAERYSKYFWMVASKLRAEHFDFSAEEFSAHHSFFMSYHFCFHCGKELATRISTGSEFLFCVFAEAGDEACYDAEKKVEFDIEFPSGEVFVGDWLRLEELTELTEAPSEGPEWKINAVEGRVRVMRYLHENFNMLSVPMGGVSRLFVDKSTGTLAVGQDYFWDKSKQEEVYPDKHWKKRVTIHSRLRAVTFWDMRDITRIMVEKGLAPTVTKARVMVRDAMREDGEDQSIVKIPAGRYRLTMAPSSHSGRPVGELVSGLNGLHAHFVLARLEN